MVVLVIKQKSERKKELVRTNPKASFTREGLLFVMKHQFYGVMPMKSDRVQRNPKNDTKKFIQHHMGSHGQFSRTY